MKADYAGKNRSYVDRDTEEVTSCEVFVATIAYGGMCYVEASRSEKQEDFMASMSDALKWIAVSLQVF